MPQYPKLESYKSPFKDKGMITVAGPCSIESVLQMEIIAQELQKSNVDYMRGGVFRAGTYPSRTRGFGFIKEDLISDYSRVARDYQMSAIIEVLDYRPEALTKIEGYSDAFQVGARQMQNYQLLNILSHKKRTVFIKRNMGATMDEFLGAAEYLLQFNMPNVVLVERGSSTFHNHVRWDLSISIIPAIKAINPDIPILVDASHGTGRRDLVEPMIYAGLAAGADGFLIEVHPHPNSSLSDPEQAYPLCDFAQLKKNAEQIYNLKRSFSCQTK